MIITILIPFRPSAGGMSSAAFTPLVQRENTWWHGPEGQTFGREQKDDIERAVKAIRKNSCYHHKIIVAIDADMTPIEGWLKEYDVEIFKPQYTLPANNPSGSFCRLTATMNEAILAQPDDAFICYAYISDLICCKNWDVPIIEARKKYPDDKYCFAPMWVEPRGMDIMQNDSSLTFNNIWVKWRERLCHCLTFARPDENSGLITEEQFDKWIKVATSSRPASSNTDGIIIEGCGARIYGYFCAICCNGKKLKEKVKELNHIGPQWDLMLEGSLGTKMVIIKSFLLHLHGGFVFDNQEIEHNINSKI